MLCREVGSNGIWKIEEISFGIQVGIGNPVIKILHGLFIAPKKFYPFCLPESLIVYRRFAIIDIPRFYQFVILFIKDLSPEGLLVTYFLELTDIMNCLHE